LVEILEDLEIRVSGPTPVDEVEVPDPGASWRKASWANHPSTASTAITTQVKKPMKNESADVLFKEDDCHLMTADLGKKVDALAATGVGRSSQRSLARLPWGATGKVCGTRRCLRNLVEPGSLPGSPRRCGRVATSASVP